MSEKSHVSMEQRQCVVCGECYDTGSILLDKRLRASMERNTVTGLGVCPKDTKEGFIVIMESADGKQPSGPMAHMRRAVFEKFFNVPRQWAAREFIFVEPAVMRKLEEAVEHAQPG